jgi:hypothetical protein
MKRPRIITFICITGYLSVLIAFPQVFSPSVKKLGLLMPAIYGLIIAGQFISYVGIWYYKQWGLLLFVLSFFVKVLFFLLSGQTGTGFYTGTAITAVFIFLLLPHYRKMNPNL